MIPRVRVVEAPDEEPVSLARAKAHLRVDIDDDDDLIAAQISAARAMAENFLHRALVTQTRELVLDCFPVSSIPLLFPPIGEVESIIYTDGAGAEITLDDARYQVDAFSSPGRIWPAYGYTWPSTRLLSLNNVKVRYTCGYGAAADVPPDIVAAILLTLGSLYENREDVVVGTTSAKLPLSAESLLLPHVVND